MSTKRPASPSSDPRLSKHARSPSPAAASGGTGLVFDAIAITSASREQGAAYRVELEQRQRLGLLPHGTLIMEVPDPAGMRVGSGGATLNALSIVSQQLCANAGYTDINEKFLKNKRILILHSGGDSQRMPISSVRGKAFTSLPSLASQHQHINSSIDFQIQRLLYICQQAPVGGCVITATDVLLLLPDDYTWGQRDTQGATGLAIYADASLGSNHGVYVVPEEHRNASHLNQIPVTSIMQKATYQELKDAHAIRPDGTVLIDSGIVYLSSRITAEFLRLHQKQPFDSCTDAGLDSGVIPFRFELYTDILYCMNPSMSYEQYLLSPPAAKDMDPLIVERARAELWKIFRPYPFYVLSAPVAAFGHVGTIAEYMHFLTQDTPFRIPFNLQKHVRTFAEYPHLCTNGVLINNLLLGHGRVDPGALVEHSVLRGNFHIESGGVASHIRTLAGLHVTPHMVIQEINLSPTRIAAHPLFRHILPDNNKSPSLRVIVVYGVNDGIKYQYQHPKATLCNRSWSHYLAPVEGKEDGPHPYPKSHTHISAENDSIWASHIPKSERTLWNARLYPILVSDKATESILWLQYHEHATVHNFQRWKQATRVSLEDILHLSDPLSEVSWRHRLSFLVDKHEIEDILLQRQNQSLLPIIKRTSAEHREELLSCLDAIASYAAPDMCARTLCCIADVLALTYGTSTSTYSRNGPCRNPQFATAYQLLDQATTATEQSHAIKELAMVRKIWMNSGNPHLIMRTARHYDGAWSRLTKKGVLSVREASCQYIQAPNKFKVQVGNWVHVEAPVRFDLMGGWSDTPPITFEHGGKVVNVAVKINGENPIGASARTFVLDSQSHDIIIIHTGYSRIHDSKSDHTVRLQHVHDLADYNNPVAPAALIKAVLVAMDLVNLSSKQTLQQQLGSHLGIESSYGIGLEIRSWSNLPQGTGLGVSSILAATIVKAIALAFGRFYELNSLCHLVLLVEQYLTTGGGWQDQVGGLYGGFKLSSSAASLPLTVTIHPIPVTPSFIQTFNQHILLIHTGQSRLAKNLLQTVLRCWYQREDVITNTVNGLVSSTAEFEQSLLSSDLAAVGQGLQKYWNYKKIMATPAPELHQANDAPVEPPHVIQLSNAIREHVHGLSLLGAGGGGFMLIITKQPVSVIKPVIAKIVSDLNTSLRSSVSDDDDPMESSLIDMKLYDATVDEIGLVIQINDTWEQAVV